MSTTITIPLFTRNNPRSNLPPHTSRKLGESNFLLSFARVYLQNENKQTLRAFREIPANGYGIVDLLVVKFRKQRHSENLFKYLNTIISFEAKLKDWRKALSQAYRYKYFSNYSIVVLPENNIQPALLHIDTFKTVGVGLWSYDKKTQNLVKIYTPNKSKPLHLTASKKIADMLLNKIKSQPIF